MNDIVNLQIWQFSLIYLLLLIVLAVMKKCRINKAKLMIVASIRMTVQLALAGFVLTYIFQNPHPAFTVAYLLAMTGFAMANAADDLQCAFSPLMVLCINEFIINWKDELLSANPIRVYITYQDVQGKNLSTELFLYVDIDFLSRESDGSGYATYTIRAK